MFFVTGTFNRPVGFWVMIVRLVRLRSLWHVTVTQFGYWYGSALFVTRQPLKCFSKKEDFSDEIRFINIYLLFADKHIYASKMFIKYLSSKFQ